MYTYFSATLPMLQFESALPFPLADFAADCERLLPEADAREVRIALELEETGAATPFLRKWQGFEHAYRNEAALIRARRLHRNPADEIRGQREFDAQINHAMEKAVGMDNPLEAERELLLLQWRRLDDLAFNREFTLEGILAYAIRLKLLQRLNAFKGQQGLKDAGELLDAVPLETMELEDN